MGKVLLVIGFVLAFGAGVAMGPKLWTPAVAAPASRSGGPASWLKTELNLDPAQQERMERIWQETAHRTRREHDERKRQLVKARDEAVSALVRAEDRGKYDAVQKTFADGNAALEREWRNSFADAVERTKQILTPEQRRKYEEFLKARGAERAAREKEQGRRVDDRATSRPGPEK
jgi:Spy/CpxP family protein refolding chaperone